MKQWIDNDQDAGWLQTTELDNRCQSIGLAFSEWQTMENIKIEECLD